MAKHSITAVFDTRTHAEQAVAQLKSSGIPATDITLLPASGDVTTYADADRSKGFWASLEELFGGTEDHATYAESLRRGGNMITVLADEMDADRIIDILEQHGSVDLDERESTWRSEGWTGGTTATGLVGESRVGTTGLGFESAGMVATGTGVAALETTAASDRRETTLPVVDRAVVPTSAAGADEVIQVVEERLDVGKRAVSRGKVRIRSSVVTRDVSENITLHGETVTVDRRIVDQPISTVALGIDPFKERVIEMEEYDEQAVVAKSAHVIEEIGIRKDGVDRVETITDTLRSTKVDVEDARVVGVTSGIANILSEVRDDMEVVGSDGAHVGIVDHMENGRIKLKKMDALSGGQHHYLMPDMVKSVAGKVMLAMTAAEAKSRWTAAA